MNNKAKINDRMYNIVSLDEYYRNPNLYDAKTTAIYDGNCLYPVYNDYGRGPGFYNVKNNPINEFIDPTEDNRNNYTPNKENLVDFQNITSMHEYIEKQQTYNNLEKTILTSSDNIFTPPVGPDDEPTMRGLKEAVIAKNIDINKYEQRFGKNFSNDIRLFKGPKITLYKLADMMNNLDMKGTLIIEDTNSDVPNPIGSKIVIDLNNSEEKE
jgi:hypothetical protein